MVEELTSGDTPRSSGSRIEIALIGCNHRTAPVDLRERVAFTPDQALQAAEELRRYGVVEEAVVISTCNRSELYGVSSVPGDATPRAMESYFTRFHQISPAEMNGRVYRRMGGEAVRHLFRVASGLDSMMLGEAEILGQVRDAYRLAFERGSTGPVLNRLFQSALEVGKRVRAETEIGARPMSVALAAVKLAERVFGNLKGHCALIVGAGAMAEQLVEHLRNRSVGAVRVVNRSRERAEELAHRLGGAAADWSSLEEMLGEPDIVVSSVSGMQPVLTRAMVERAMARRSGRAIFAVDLGVPRNVEAEAAGIYNVYLYNIDNLGEIVEQNKKAREAEVPRAEAVISEHVAKFLAWQNSVEAISFLEELRCKLHAEGEAFVADRLSKVENLSAESRERLARLARELVDEILKEPADRLRRARKLRQRLEGLEALRGLFGLDREER